MNKVSLIGNVTRDLELKSYKEGNGAYVRFTLAINNYNSKTKESSADFINIVAFGNKAEVLSKYVTKGRKIAIDGKLNTGSYVSAEGEKRFTTEVILKDFYFVDYKKESVG